MVLNLLQNSNATGSYTDNSFTGDNSVTWSYLESRDDGGYQINWYWINVKKYIQ